VSPRYQALRGTKDILPDETTIWQRVERTTREVFGRYGCREIRTPIIEPTELFVRSVGESSDIVRKEIYALTVGDESICLRPEATASVARAVVEHALHRGVAEGYPERLFYIGPMFRHERPQRGRQRQFHQIGVEVLGAREPLADAEAIQMADALLRELGLSGTELVVNSVGDARCRPAYRERLQAWLAPRLGRLCADCNRRATENPLRVFDCKVPEDRQLLAEAPTIDQSLCADCTAHLVEVGRHLERLGLGFRLSPHIVRGLDYYQRTVFEIVAAGLGAQNAVLGGGRYDGLLLGLGGPDLPGFGFAIGMERLISLLPDRGESAPAIDVAVIALGPEGFEAAVGLVQRLRAAGVSCVMPLAERPMGAQLRRADKMGARHALFLGHDELAAGLFGLKDLQSGHQREVREDQIVASVKAGAA